MQDFERTFLLAWNGAFSRLRLLLAFSALVASGLLFVFCSAISMQASPWVVLSLRFLPFFASSGLLLGAGVLIAKIHFHERKGLKLSLGRLLMGSADLVIGTSYLALPPLLLYFILWLGMGMVCFLQQLPVLGPFFQVFFSFAPFLILALTLCLGLISLALLFWVAPIAARGALKRLSLVREIALIFTRRPLFAISSFAIACLPLLIIGGILGLSAVMADHTLAASHESYLRPLEWFFMMLPFAALLSPPLIFFFQFATLSAEKLERVS